MNKATPVAVEKFADCGPGKLWFVHHPDGFLIELAIESRAIQIADEINAGRAANSIDAEREVIANRAREIAGHYPEASDGRNTFVLFAEWVEGRSK
ncbi:hypothetical protein MesoLjLc_51090 [Mesorhizobium sp. L-8-10]|uniref:hypothetical protein n=1 Tax=Mesorhizobium sp. L-8-10 TaxID=2744523 RepID=UPI0019289A99|nr:hypothetical protein [Mesorhizobium sp. L-8-10]BCH33179.1 hypothetical protein MesoLjLc_51090 [Mesorhizobium sp. L-8-10]